MPLRQFKIYCFSIDDVLFIHVVILDTMIGSHKKLGQLIIRLLGDKKLRDKLGNNARLKCIENNHPSKIAKKTWPPETIL